MAPTLLKIGSNLQSGIALDDLLDFYRGLTIKMGTHMSRLSSEALRVGQLKVCS